MSTGRSFVGIILEELSALHPGPPWRFFTCGLMREVAAENEEKIGEAVEVGDNELGYRAAGFFQRDTEPFCPATDATCHMCM